MSFLFGKPTPSSAPLPPKDEVGKEVGQAIVTPLALQLLPKRVPVLVAPSKEVVKFDEDDEVKLDNARLLATKRRLASVKMRKPAGNKLERGLGGVYPLDINFALDITTTSGGVYLSLQNGLIISGTGDFTALAGLFDVVRCHSVTIHYQPLAGGSEVAATGTSSLVHQPFIVCGDDDAVTNIAFATLVQRDARDPRNHYTSTTKAWKKTFSFKPTFNTTGTTSVLNNLACWQDTNAMARATGGLLLSARTDTRNVSAVLGTALFSFHTEWSTRL